MPEQPNAPRNDAFDVLTIYNPSSQPFPVYYNSELHAIIQPGKAIQLVKLIAGDIENGAIKHLIDRMCRLNGKPRNDPNTRNAWYQKVVINHKSNVLPKVLTLEDQAKLANAELSHHPVDVPPASLTAKPTIDPNSTSVNSNWKFDPITGAPLTKKTPVITPDQVDTSNVEIQQTSETLPDASGTSPNSTPTVPPPVHPDPATNTILEGIRGEHTGDDGERVIGEVPPSTEEKPYVPTKNWPDNPTKEDLMRYAKDVTMMNVDDPTTKLALEKQTVEELKATLKYDPFA